MSDGASPVQTVEARTHGRYVVRVPRAPGPWPLVMAARYRADALIILAGDVPPDVIDRRVVPLPPVLLGRGTKDEWYTDAKEAADRAALARIGARVETCVFDGGHEWTDAFRAAASTFLRRAQR